MKTWQLNIKGTGAHDIGKLVGIFQQNLLAGGHVITAASITTNGNVETLIKEEEAGPVVLSGAITITVDGDKFCALIGPNIQAGVAGFGDTPTEALEALTDELERIKTTSQKAPEGQGGSETKVNGAEGKVDTSTAEAKAKESFDYGVALARAGQELPTDANDAERAGYDSVKNPPADQQQPTA